MGEAEQTVRKAADALGYEIVADAQIRRPVEHRHVDPGIVHLGHEVFGGVGHVRYRRREVLLGVLLSIDGPLEPSQTPHPEGDVFQGVQAGPVRLVDEGRFVSGRVVPQPPGRLEVGRNGMLHMAAKNLRRRKTSVTMQGRDSVCVPIEYHLSPPKRPASGG